MKKRTLVVKLEKHTINMSQPITSSLYRLPKPGTWMTSAAQCSAGLGFTKMITVSDHFQSASPSLHSLGIQILHKPPQSHQNSARLPITAPLIPLSIPSILTSLRHGNRNQKPTIISPRREAIVKCPRP